MQSTEPDDRGRFSAWYGPAAAATRAPARPGVFQVRTVRGLVTYPQGKSAMLLYGYAIDLGRALTDLTERCLERPDIDPETWLYRHQITAHEDAARALYEAVMARFAARFGSPPRLHEHPTLRPARD